jgi:hypothetical protein
MAIMRICFFLLSSFLTLSAIGQDASNISVKLVGWQPGGKPLPALIDTIHVNSLSGQKIKTYTSVAGKDGVFIIPELSVGTYQLLFSALPFCITPVKIVVCSNCDNQFTITAFPKQPAENCNLFTMVEINATYEGGDKAIAKNFLKAIGKKNKQKLTTIPDISIRFFLTKQRTISDIVFKPAVVDQDIKNIILKGLTSLKPWIPAIQNGLVADSEYHLDIQTLLTN